MATNRKRKRPAGQMMHPQPRFGWLVLLSFALHLSLVLVLSGLHLPRRPPPRAPVYFVDLLNRPVARPQAGRPDARPATLKTPAKVAPAKPTPLPSPPPVKTAPLKTVAAKPPPPAKEPPAKEPPAKEPPAASDYRQTEETIDLMRKLAQVAAKDTRQAPAATPVGMPEGQGDQAGVDQLTWLKAFFKASWSLSKYQVTRRDLETRVEVRYSPEGLLLDYRILESSGDRTFDDSVKGAILKEQQLPFAPGRRITEEIVFNLKDLLE